ncbi:MAG: CcmD family protein [Candidatus Binatia bacterium]
MEHFPFLFTAYAIVWTVIFLYVLSIDRRGRRTERELDELKKRLGSGPR